MALKKVVGRVGYYDDVSVFLELNRFDYSPSDDGNDVFL